MLKERHERLYHLHSASGMWLGYFMYFVSITGCFALFFNEIKSWEDPARRLTVAENPVNIEPLFDGLVADFESRGDVTFLTFRLPDEEHPFYSTTIGIRKKQIVDGEEKPAGSEFKTVRWDTHTGMELPERSRGVGAWLYNLHRDLNWPGFLGGRQIGRALAGLAGVIMLLSIISGILIHTKILKEVFTLRFYRSVRLKWQDAHKVIGVWGIPPFAMFALTGAFLGIITLIAPATAFLTVNGDVGKLASVVTGPQQDVVGEPAVMLPITELMAIRREENPSQPPASIQFRNWGLTTAQATLNFRTNRGLAANSQSQFNAVTGEPVTNPPSVLTDSVPATVLTSYVPLHYGTYGGIALKFLYLIVGLALSLMTALGLMLWVERRRHGNAGQKSRRYYIGLSRTITGAVVGVPLATGLVLGFDRLYAGAEEARFAAIGSAYFGTVFLSVLYAFIRRNDYRAAKELMALTGISFIAASVLNIMTTVGTLGGLFDTAHKMSSYVDLSLVVIGLTTLLIALKMPRSRPENKKRERQRLVVDGAVAESVLPAE